MLEIQFIVGARRASPLHSHVDIFSGYLFRLKYSNPQSDVKTTATIVQSKTANQFEKKKP
ncbi:hypothetical protein PL8927_710066 [Planktothrix serta PCC 8927]|uniref:Uncharacterized protein n=1 Tax=Planktothrix serta PCC 8927 TaxID=671068 RepID=A0A7Z9BRY9_9CYAN|nr:hypothetical protein PL8927_710066 [Planktothrix serta PCC 8927]